MTALRFLQDAKRPFTRSHLKTWERFNIFLQHIDINVSKVRIANGGWGFVHALLRNDKNYSTTPIPLFGFFQGETGHPRHFLNATRK